MREILLNLIRERTSKVLLAVELLKEKFGDINFNAAKNDGRIPKKGFLDAAETIHYNFHGRGCDVNFGDETIGFDFNFQTENHAGFNRNWLRDFLNQHQSEFGELINLPTENFQRLLIELEREKRIKFDEAENLYYLIDRVKIKSGKAKERELALS